MRCFLLLAMVGCGGAPSKHGASPNDAIMYLSSNLPDAQVYVDGRFVGPIDLVKRGIAVDPGKHRVELRHDDY
ncbi:MAG: hypothetical protein ABI678_32935, partial [Kofleriaceae bacterium]